jgi:signal transduction histidine kinase
MGLFRPPEFERRTLLSVLDGLVIQHEELTGHAVTLNVQGTLPDVSLPVKICLYRVLQQALANAARHADVDQYFVALSSNETQIMMDVVDHGKGFDVATTQEQSEGIHFGLTGMRERVEILDGTFSLQSTPGSGTRVRVVVPYP